MGHLSCSRSRPIKAPRKRTANRVAAPTPFTPHQQLTMRPVPDDTNRVAGPSAGPNIVCHRIGDSRMKNPLATDLSTNMGLLLARIPLGLYFALSGYHHFKTLNFATQYVAALPTWMPSEARAGYSNVLPFIEMAIGALLILR